MFNKPYFLKHIISIEKTKKFDIINVFVALALAHYTTD